LGSKEFLASSGLGNELAFYVFDYSPEYELDIREFIGHSLDYLAKKNISVSHVNLFEIVIDYLGTRNLLDRALSTQREKGNAAIAKALRGPLNEEKLAKVVVDRARPANHELVVMSGVGSSWPMVRSHTLLNALHPLMKGTPLVTFYPGKYDGQYLSLFGRLERRYYRAFRLVA
jgi:hypothetical protein